MKTHFLKLIKSGTGQWRTSCGTKTDRNHVTINQQKVNCKRCIDYLMKDKGEQ